MTSIASLRNTSLSALLGLAALLMLPAVSCAADALFDALVAKKGEPARSLIERPALYREAELKGLPCSVPDFDFLLDRPPASIALAGRIHKSLDRYTISVASPGVFHVDDGDKLVGDMELVGIEPGRRLYYVTGHWKFVPGIKLDGRMAIVVEYQEADGPKGKAIDAHAKGYMAVDNSLAGEAFKLFAYLFPRKVDARISRFATSVRKVIVAINDDPAGACARLENAPHVPPEEVREFCARFAPGKGAHGQ